MLRSRYRVRLQSSRPSPTPRAVQKTVPDAALKASISSSSSGTEPLGVRSWARKNLIDPKQLAFIVVIFAAGDGLAQLYSHKVNEDHFDAWRWVKSGVTGLVAAPFMWRWNLVIARRFNLSLKPIFGCNISRWVSTMTKIAVDQLTFYPAFLCYLFFAQSFSVQGIRSGSWFNAAVSRIRQSHMERWKEGLVVRGVAMGLGLQVALHWRPAIMALGGLSLQGWLCYRNSREVTSPPELGMVDGIPMNQVVGM
ncbi:hypothetical protein F5Y15DRAFT_419992 [Xylariaceae sp. FL0016]|nr:hypothetical protein F5Y15DRAFT_419992 [Xylariaceae sp. FL0016]